MMPSPAMTGSFIPSPYCAWHSKRCHTPLSTLHSAPSRRLSTTCAQPTAYPREATEARIGVRLRFLSMELDKATEQARQYGPSLVLFCLTLWWKITWQQPSLPLSPTLSLPSLRGAGLMTVICLVQLSNLGNEERIASTKPSNKWTTGRAC